MPVPTAWLTWDEAADLVGCPVPTIDWYQRTGRILSRRHQQGRLDGSLDRTSVEEFATWWTERRARIDGARERAEQTKTRRAAAGLTRRTDRQPPDPTGWLTPREAAECLDLAATYVATRMREGRLPATEHDGRMWMRQTDVDQLATQRADADRWISHAAAAAIIGCAVTTVNRAASAGAIVSRDVLGNLPSLERASVEEYARRRAADLQAAAEQHQAIEAARPRPPDDGDVWFDTTTAALVIGVTPGRVRQLASAGRLPCTPRAGRRWFRRDHVEQYAAARASRA